MRLIFSHRSDPGLVRPTNEDAYAVQLLDPRENAALLIVADGMGGYEGGEIASHLAVETVVQRVVQNAADWAEKLIQGEGLVQAFDAANRAILQAQQDRPDLSNMGTTLTTVLVWADRLIIGHLGDSKACVIRRDGTTEPITSDHNLAGELLQSGHLTQQQAAMHPQRHVLTRALGMGETVIVERRDLQWQQGDTLLLYTDGLSNMVSLAEIEAEAAGEFATLAERLIGLANSRGGHDNITVLAARWEG